MSEIVDHLSRNSGKFIKLDVNRKNAKRLQTFAYLEQRDAVCKVSRKNRRKIDKLLLKY